MSKTVNLVFRKSRKRNYEAMEITLKNQIIPNKYPVSWDDLKQHTELGRAYWQSESKSKESIKHHQIGEETI